VARAVGLPGVTLALAVAGCSWLSGKGGPFWSTEDLGAARGPSGLLAAVLADRAPPRDPLPDELRAVESTAPFRLERVLGRSAMIHPEPSEAAFLPDGRRLLSLGRRGDIRIWDPITRTQLADFPSCGDGFAAAFAISTDGRLIAYGTDVGWICVVDLADGHVVRHWQAHTTELRALRLTPDGDLMSFGYQQQSCSESPFGTSCDREEAGGELRRWHLDRADPVFEVKLGSATKMAISADGTLVVGRDSDGTLHAWDGRGRALWTGKKNAWAGFALADHDRRLVVAEPRRVHLLDALTGAERGDLTPASRRIVWFGQSETEPWRDCVGVMPDGRAVTVPSNDSFAYVWDLDARREVGHPLGGDFPGCNASAAFSPDGTLLATGDLALWDAIAYRPLPYRSVGAILMSADGRRALVWSEDMTAHLWDVDRGVELARRRLGRPVSLALSAGGDRMLVASEDGWARLYDVATGAPLWSLPGRARTGQWKLSPDGRFAVTSSYENGLAVHDVTTGKELWRAPLAPFSLAVAAFSPDGRSLAHVDRDDRVTIRRAADGTEVRRFGLSKPRVSLTYSSDGRYLLADEHEPVFFDAATGTEVRRISVFQGLAALGPGGLVAFSKRQTSCSVELSRLPDGEPLGTITLDPRFGVVTTLTFSADGTRLLIGTARGQTLVLAAAPPPANPPA
jgi:WD40 repeat protein